MPTKAANRASTPSRCSMLRLRRSVGTNPSKPPSTTDKVDSGLLPMRTLKASLARATAPSLREPSRSAESPSGLHYSRYPMNNPGDQVRAKPLTPGHSGRCALGCAAAAVGSEEHSDPE